MRVAYCLYGFLAEDVYTAILNKIKQSFSEDTTLDIYYSCPTIYHEQEPFELDRNSIESEFKNAGFGDVCIEWRTYSPNEFINHVKRRNLPKKSEVTQLYYYRLLSAFYGISKTLQLLDKQKDKQYDAIVITRFNYIHLIGRLTDLDIPLKEGGYIFRDGWYKGPAEDRIFYGRYEDFICFKDIYEFVVENVNEKNATTEYLIYEFLRTKFPEEKLYIQGGIHPFELATKYKEYKRTPECASLVDKTYKDCGE